MKVIIHRGTKEIGGSCVELIADNSRILIDLGMPLVDSKKQPFDSKSIAGKSIDELKTEKTLPDVKGLYKDEEPQIDAILISHSHLDHYGLLDFANDKIPVYISRGAKELVDATNIFLNKNVQLSNTHIIKHLSPFHIKDFKITPYLVDHSAFDAFAFFIEADNKKVFYSGDFRGHGRKGVLLKKMIKNPPVNIDCLLMEGSMLGRNEMVYKDETEVEARIVEILKEQNNITFLFSSSQNIDRLVSAYRACLQTDTTFVIDIYTAFILQKLGEVSKKIPQFDWKNIRVKFFNYHAEKLAGVGHKELLYIYNRRKIDMDELNEKKNKVLMLARDNSIFPQIIRNINSPEEAKIIYSMWEGYLTDKFKNFCRDKKIEIEQVHTSGHAVLNDLQRFAKALSPKCLVPIHTFEAARYSDFFENVKQMNDAEPFTI
ncbi:MAG: MBL fold metallo-hydrolase [Phycisphaerae bacterium]|nr:MBL fold metallo-hydrolase [Phycisphaerae bacterium]